jgi:NADH-quinone oxidoreductase subunit J
MSAEKLVFYALAAVLVAAGAGVVTVRNSVRAALLLVLCFFTSAGIWLLLGAEFLAIALVLVYVGAVMVLWLFVVMMLDIRQDEMREGFARHFPLGILVALAIVVEMAAVLSTVELGTPEPAGAGASNATALARLLYTDYLYPFEIAGVILLIGIVAAISLTLRGRRQNKYVPPGQQIHVRRQDRVRLVAMPAERDDAGGGA